MKSGEWYLIPIPWQRPINVVLEEKGEWSCHILVSRMFDRQGQFKGIDGDDDQVKGSPGSSTD